MEDYKSAYEWRHVYRRVGKQIVARTELRIDKHLFWLSRVRGSYLFNATRDGEYLIENQTINWSPDCPQGYVYMKADFYVRGILSGAFDDVDGLPCSEAAP